MPIDQKLRVLIDGNTTGLNKALTTASTRLNQFGTRLQSIGTSLSTRLTLPIALAGGAAIKMASDFEESLNKVDVAFKDSSSIVKEFSKTTLENFGIAEGTALDMAALFGDMGTSMGIAVDSAAKMSTALVGLAGDLASFKNMNIKEVTTALNGVFTGETESLKRLGIIMTEINLKQFAQEQGIKKNIKAMTQAEKVNLRFQFVLKNTANAQGDFARTSGGAANQMRIFQETLKELAANFGQIILPAFTKIVKKANVILKSFSNLDIETKKLILTIAGISAVIAPVIMVLGTFIKSVGFISSGVMTAIPVITKLGSALKILGTIALTNPIGIIVTGVSALTIGVIELLHRLNPVVSRIQTFFNLIRSGGNFVAFNNLQMETTAKNLARIKEEEEQGIRAKKEYTNNIKLNNSAYQELGNTINTSVVPALRKVSTLETDLKPLGLVNVGANVKPTADTSGMSNLANNKTSEQAPFINTLQQGVILTDLLTQSFQNLGSGGNFFEPIIQHIKQLVIKLVAATAAAAVLNAIMGGGASGFSSMFSQFSGIPIKPMANGGIVSAPTMGLMGEYSGAKSNPEVVAPLDKLKTMIGTTGSQNVQVGGEFKIKGQDLVVAVQRATNQRNRIK